MIAQKKSGIILITALIMMALITIGCERSYAPLDESLATPTIEGESAFPEALPSDMEGVFAAGAQTSTALAAAGDAAASTTETPTGDVELSPEAESPAGPTATATLPVIAATTAVPTTAIVGKPASYTLKKGEFPYCIARRFNIDPGELLALNNLSSAQAQSLQPGLTLSIPQSGSSFPSTRALNAHPVSYTVPQNTTVYGIACYFGDVDPAAIMSGNTIVDPNNVTAGTILKIP